MFDSITFWVSAFVLEKFIAEIARWMAIDPGLTSRQNTLCFAIALLARYSMKDNSAHHHPTSIYSLPCEMTNLKTIKPILIIYGVLCKMKTFVISLAVLHRLPCVLHAGHSLTSTGAAEPFLQQLFDDISNGEPRFATLWLFENSL